MKKTIVISLFLTQMMAVNAGAITLSRQKLIEDAEIDKMCEMTSHLECLKMTKSTCESVIKECTSKFPDDVDTDRLPELYAHFDQCIHNRFPVSKENWDKCDRLLDEENSDTDEGNISDPYDGQASLLIQDAPAVKKAITDSGIPLYPGSQMVIHIDAAGTRQISPGVNDPLPAATFATEDGFDQVVQYYRKALPAYKVYTLDQGGILLMKNGPEKFDFIKHYAAYFTLQHVLIEHIVDNHIISPVGSKTKIEISYKSK